MRTESDLEPCPHCSYDTPVRMVLDMERPTPRFYVLCQDCLARGPKAYDELHAKQGWNARRELVAA